ncbi:MAG: hypothetical protein CVU39_05980 [Chloroflexi bacterium HGW-Chloroflexi-10]|nr:MAG: hypothetical protein CVU39_05980 [Chloroflexi bacterium HGW-Chloroflexi-10]
MKSKHFIYIWLMSLTLLGGTILFANQNVQSLVSNTFKEIIDEGQNSEQLLEESTGEIVSFEDQAPIFSSDAPLSFIFPTPGVPPVSYWRPPLYEIPWALTPYDHFYFSRPIAADEVNWPLADYRYGYFFPNTDIVHTGIDIDATRGTPVIASASGTVVWSGFGLYYGNNNPDDPYGMAVTIQHDFGWEGNQLLTVYAHMDRIDVELGQKVEMGEQLGIVGNTGNTTGPHLHFEVRLASNSFFRTRNPELWLSPPQGWGVLVGQFRKPDQTTITFLDVFVRNLETNQNWMVRTYGPSSVNRDDYYQENLVLSDLPAGKYLIYFTYLDANFQQNIEISPGAVTFLRFQENLGFSQENPNIQLPQTWHNVILEEDSYQ